MQGPYESYFRRLQPGNAHLPRATPTPPRHVRFAPAETRIYIHPNQIPDSSPQSQLYGRPHEPSRTSTPNNNLYNSAAPLTYHTPLRRRPSVLHAAPRRTPIVTPENHLRQHYASRPQHLDTPYHRVQRRPVRAPLPVHNITPIPETQPRHHGSRPPYPYSPVHQRTRPQSHSQPTHRNRDLPRRRPDPTVTRYEMRQPQPDRYQLPPSDWRIDYCPPGYTTASQSPCSKFGACLAQVCRAFTGPRIDVLLSASGHLHWDLRFHYDTVHWDKAIQGRGALRRVAISPNLSRLCITHPLLPWNIVVKRRRSEGIRIIDILRAIYACLHTMLRTKDLWNQKITTEHHVRIQNAAILRDGMVSRQRCVDFLEDRYMFAGLEPIEDDLFRMKTTSMSGSKSV